MQRKALRYDKSGDQHYDYISAWIKSTRGSDPDASLYYLAAMLEGGEDARFIVRRMVIFASEDVGNADPQALVVATAAAAAVEHVGLPEATYALAQAAIYLALAPKSNSAGSALAAARAHIREVGAASPPASLRSAAYPASRKLGRGIGYEYPHSAPGRDQRPGAPAGGARGPALLRAGRERARAARAAGRDPAGARSRCVTAANGATAGIDAAGSAARAHRAEARVCAAGLAPPGGAVADALDVFAPATGARLGSVPPIDLEAAVAAAKTAHPLWSLVPVSSRARYIRRTAVAMLDELDSLALALADETGWPRTHIVLSELLPAVRGLHALAVRRAARAGRPAALAARGPPGGPHDPAGPVAGGRDRPARPVRVAVGRTGARGRGRAAGRQRRGPRRRGAARGPAPARRVPARRGARRAADRGARARPGGPGRRLPPRRRAPATGAPRDAGRARGRAARRRSWRRRCGPRSPAPAATRRRPGRLVVVAGAVPGLVEALTAAAAALRVGDPRDDGHRRRPARPAAGRATSEPLTVAGLQRDLRRTVRDRGPRRPTTRASSRHRPARCSPWSRCRTPTRRSPSRRATGATGRSRSGRATRAKGERVARRLPSAEHLGRPPRHRPDRRAGAPRTPRRPASARVARRLGAGNAEPARRRDVRRGADRVRGGAARARVAPLAGAAHRSGGPAAGPAAQAVSDRTPPAPFTHRRGTHPSCTDPGSPLPRIFRRARNAPQRRYVEVRRGIHAANVGSPAWTGAPRVR